MGKRLSQVALFSLAVACIVAFFWPAYGPLDGAEEYASRFTVGPWWSPWLSFEQGQTGFRGGVAFLSESWLLLALAGGAVGCMLRLAANSPSTQSPTLPPVAPGVAEPRKIRLATLPLHLSAVLCVLAGLFMIRMFSFMDGGIRSTGAVIILLLCVALPAAIECVVIGLRHRRSWARVISLCIFGLYTPTALAPLGIMGLWGLLDRRSWHDCQAQ